MNFLSDIPVLGNLFSDNSRQLTKQNLLVFLTPHIVRTREDLQALSLDERQKYIRTLGRTEVNNMPPSQFEQMYQPSFNRAVSPQEDLQQYQSPSSSMPGPSPLSGPPSYPSSSTSPPSIGAASPFSSTTSRTFADVGRGATADHDDRRLTGACMMRRIGSRSAGLCAASSFASLPSHASPDRGRTCVARVCGTCAILGAIARVTGRTSGCAGRRVGAVGDDSE